MKDAEIPSNWSQVATDIMVSKYFRKAGVPTLDVEGNPTFSDEGKMVTGPERSARQVISRLTSTWRHWGEENGYFASTTDAQAFEDELSYMLVHQMAAPNSPQWFNTGLQHAYGITGPAQGFWYVDPATEETKSSPDSYTRPAPHACFPAGTKIETLHGFKTIEDVVPGDEVMTHTGMWQPVLETMSRHSDKAVRIRFASHADLVCTPNHPILVAKKGWVPAKDLAAGDHVVTRPSSGNALEKATQDLDPDQMAISAKVTQLEHIPFSDTVYNFQVEEDESYVANGVVVHNCFIQAVDDDLVSAGGIMDLWVREARLFKFGSGTGSNFSQIRGEGEPLSGGGKSSGLMSFLKVGDRAAGAIKSGGTTRRAAKMVILDIDHPDIETFINWKADEEKKVRALIAAGYPSDFNGEAYATVSGQNSNNSVRLSNEFVAAVHADDDWSLLARTDGSVMRTVKARDLWTQIADAAWQCADPGVQFDTTIQEWHTSPAGGKIRATNPCSEYVFLDNTACNLASLNLVAFYNDDDNTFDLEAYQHAVRIWTIVLEISVTMAHFPSAEIAQGSYDYRTLGLGYSNLGSLLMRMGVPYDSDEGRGTAGALTSILTGHSYATSAEMAEALGPFAKFAENADSMLRVMRNHRRAAYNAPAAEYQGVSTKVMGIDAAATPAHMLAAAQNAWDVAIAAGEKHGYRNAQTTVLAPTGTIGLLMDCDTTGVEPDFSLVKFKKLAGGGYFKIANQSVAPALRNLGYSEERTEQILNYVTGSTNLHRAPHINTASLIAKGFTADDIDKVHELLPGVFDLNFAFNQWTLGEETMQRLGFTAKEYNASSFDMLAALGFTPEQINDANEYVCGRQTIEGAPGLLEEHLPVFDCANRNGKYGKRFIHHTGHIRMMAAAQPFISGAISKTINMPNEVSIADIQESYQMSWELGLKAVALYRDGSKASQPLSTTSGEGVSEETSEEVEEALVVEQMIHGGMFQPGISPTAAYADMPRPRFLLPGRRDGYTQEARIGGHKVFLRTGEYADGTLGEVFIDLAKEGATLRGILSCFAIAVSKGLQYGVPLEEFVDTFTFQTFEPRGLVEGHPNIKMSNSIVDYIFRTLGVEYLERDELAQVPPERSGLPEPPSGAAVDAGYQPELIEAAMENDIRAQIAAAKFTNMATPTPTAKRSPAVTLTSTEGGAIGSASGLAGAAVQAVLADKMGDAPLCDTCGHITVRNGSCYRCLNCGDSKGCS